MVHHAGGCDGCGSWLLLKLRVLYIVDGWLLAVMQILKFEWPSNWPSFIGDIVGASKTNESLCQNNMIILKLLRCVWLYMHVYIY